MAHAPTPGKAAAKRVALKITVNGDERVLHLADLGPNDDLLARKETGLPVSQFVTEDSFGLDSLAILWWVARRKNGEPRLKFREVLKTFPTMAEAADAVDIEEIIDGDDEVDEGPLSSAEG